MPSMTERTATTRGTTDWPAIVTLYIAGVAAAGQLAKLSGISEPLRAELGFGLETLGVAISLVEAAGALGAVLVGVVIGRVGVRRSVIAGLALVALASAAEGLAPNVTLLLIARGIEGVGYLGVVVSAPTLMAGLATPKDRTTALSLWSSFVPVGIAATLALSGLAARPLGWRGTLLADAALVSVIALATLIQLGFGPDAARTDNRPARRFGAGGPAFILACGFGCCALLQVAALALLPVYLMDARGLAESTAGSIGAIVAVSSILGSLMAAWSLRRGAAPTLLAVIGFLVPAALLFATFSMAVPLEPAVVAAVLFSAIGGIIAALLFARMPAMVPSLSDLAAGNGLIGQFGASGSLAGPPLVAALAARFGWTAAPIAILVASILGLALVAWAERARSGRQAQPRP